jgi:uncharacterized protein (TIGR00369 family)
VAGRDRVASVREQVERSRFHAWIGMSLERLEAGESELGLDVRPEHVNLTGVLHGGVISSLADAATGIAMLSALEEGRSHVTTSLTMTFLASGRLGDRVVAHGRVLKGGRRFGYAEADVLGPEGTLLARATATFLIRDESRPA